MVRIGCISDTHIPVAAEAIPSTALDLLKGVDLILHAGDIVALSVIDGLRAIAPVRAVAGNMDFAETAQVLPVRDKFEIDGIRIGLIHGWGAPEGLIDRIRREFVQVDCIVFGHTHQSFSNFSNGIFFFNPGSATDKRFSSVNSIGILEIDDSISGRIIEI